MLSKLKRFDFKVNGLIVGLIIFLGLLFRLVLIDQSFWLDEAAQAIESNRELRSQFDILADFQPPLYHIFVHMFTRVSLVEWWLRLSSVIPGLITILMTIKLGKKLFNDYVGIFSGLYLATSSFHIFYSQELRPYSFACMWGVLSFWYLIKLMDKKKKVDKRIKSWFSWGYVATVTFGLYSLYLFPFLIVAQGLGVVIYNKNKVRLWFKNVLVSGLLFLPWAPIFIKQFKAGMELIELLPGWSEAVSLPAAKSLPLVIIKFFVGRINIDLSSFGILFTLFILGLFCYLIFRVYFFELKRNGKFSKNIGLLFIWFFVPLLISFIVSIFIPILEPKRVLFLLPIFYLLLVKGLMNLKSRKWLVVVLILVNLVSVSFYYFKPINHREKWREAVAFVEEKGGEDSNVVFSFVGPFAPWQWYQTSKVEAISTNVFLVTKDTDLDDIFGRKKLNDLVFVFEYLMDLTDPDRRVFDWFDVNGFTKIEIKDFPGVGFVHIYLKNKTFALGV